MHHVASLPASEQRRILAAIETCHDIDDEAGLRRYTQQELAAVLDYECFACGIGAADTSKVAGMRALSVINVSFDPDYFRRIVHPNGTVISPQVSAWRDLRRPQFVDRDWLRARNPEWSAAMRSAGVRNTAGHGLSDLNDTTVGYFGFGNIGPAWDPVQMRLIELLVPHLYVVTQRILGPKIQASRVTLSRRQCEVLKWVALGKSSEEIGMILGLSQFTIQIHITKVMRKLNVSSRAHAVAKAMSLGLIQL